MAVEWMLYALLISGLVSVAAWLAERGVRAGRWPTRWVWSGALVASVVGPMMAWLRPVSAPVEATAGAALGPGDYVLQVVPLVAGGLESTAPAVGTVLLAGWAAATGLLLVVVAGLAVRLDVRCRRWPERVVDGVAVLVSEETGPAALGLVRGRVVVPRWALALEAEKRRLLVLHEAEHVRARDPQLALLGLLLCVAAPWNLPLWWQLRRLRLAIEMDCDARVLRRSGRSEARRAYGDLLLAVGQRRARLALALAESPRLLERRIQMIAENGKGRAWVRGGLLMALAGVVLALACEAPEPIVPVDADPDFAAAEASSLDDGVVGLAQSCAAVFVDGERVAADAVDPDLTPRIQRIEVVKGKALESASLDDACGLIWIVTDDAPAGLDRRLREVLEPADELATMPAEAPGAAFTPMTVRPRVTNADAVGRALEEYYPPLLRDAGIGGTIDMWFFIDETGTVQDLRVNESSGYDALDSAALRVAQTMEFSPAMNGDERVSVWVSIPIQFKLD